MSEANLKVQLQADMKSSMKTGDKSRLLVIRTMLAAIKQIEVDERIELDDDRIVGVLDKMLKQRRESISQFTSAGRDDLIAIEDLILVELVARGFAADDLGKDILVVVFAVQAHQCSPVSWG